MIKGHKLSSFDNKLKGFCDQFEVEIEHLLALPQEPDPALATLWQAIRHGALNGGKRLRPFLLVETAKLFGTEPDIGLWRAATAVELVHCYSLVHDDLPAMDDSDLRRGRPSVHRAFDEATAILAGDALLTESFSILADPATHQDSQVRSQLIQMMAQAAGPRGMVAGQMLDMAAEAGAALTLDQLQGLHRLKTGAMIELACCAGAIFAGASDTQLRPIRLYADNIGLAFQIIDDVLDATSDASALGKPVGQDDQNGKTTFVDLYGVEKSQHIARSMVEAACAALEEFSGNAHTLKQIAGYIISRQT